MSIEIVFENLTNIGKQAEVRQLFKDSTDSYHGKVFFQGALWNAKSHLKTATALHKGDTVVIVGREGTALIVETIRSKM